MQEVATYSLRIPFVQGVPLVKYHVLIVRVGFRLLRCWRLRTSKEANTQHVIDRVAFCTHKFGPVAIVFGRAGRSFLRLLTRFSMH